VRGRKPQPTALRVLRGNPGRRPLPPDEPQAPALDGADVPDFLSDDARAEWVRLVPLLTSCGVLTETDRSALGAYCTSYGQWKEATAQIKRFGMVLKTKEGRLPVVSPYVKIAHNALLQMRAFLVEFGMTPSSRVRVHAKPPAKPQSKWADAL